MAGNRLSTRTFKVMLIIPDDLQGPYLAQHSVTTLLRHRFERLQHCSHIGTLCCAKNRRYKSSRVTSLLERKATNKSSLLNKLLGHPLYPELRF